MKIAFTCSGCGKGYEVDASRAGRKGRCKSCGVMMVVPAMSTKVAQDSHATDEYAMEDTPSGELKTEPTSFARTSNDPDGRTRRERKESASKLLEQVKGEAEEVITSYAGLIRRVLVGIAISGVVLGIIAATVNHGTFYVGASLVGLGLLIIFAGYALGVYIAYTEDLLHAALFLTIPIYTGYYIVTNWDEMWRSFALMVVGGILLSIGATILESQAEPDEELINEVQASAWSPSKAVGPSFFAHIPG